MPVALETFLSHLSSSGIVPEDKLKVVVNKKASFADGEALARDMIKSRLLTKYQAEQILGGRGKSLTMGKYQILEKIGAGGMGQVYKAFHSGTERIVAIKVILGKGKINPEVVKRFEREVKAAAKLVHSNIITVFDADQADGRIFMVMEYIKGDDLGELLRKKRELSVSEVVDYILQAARGLKYAHDEGVIHRDIKPGNILVDLSGNVKIVDMGLAKLESKGDEESISMLTASASIMGTIDFMSPEQGFSSKNVDARADIYSLGATLFFLLTRKVMFPGDSAFEKMLAHRESPIPSLCNSRVGISPDLEIAFMKMVAKKVEDRYANMAEVISALSRLQTEIGENLIGVEDLATTHFERGSYPETIDVETVLTNKGKEIDKETDKHIGGKTLEYISNILQKTYTPKVLAASAIIVLVLMVLMLLMKPAGTNVNPKPNEPLKKGLSSPGTSGKEEVADLGKGVKLDLLLIPAGKFMMGSPLSEKGRRDNENQHEVTITKPFYMGKYEVTQEQWEAVMANNPSKIKGAKLPVTNVTWLNCQKFIKKLNEMNTGVYRLPTEAEWEYACRAGTTTVYSFGERITKDDANWGVAKMPNSIKEVGNYKANAFGLFDMHGNVWEWCEDFKSDYLAGAVIDPKGPATGTNRVLRGGSFANYEGALNVRSSYRLDYFTPSYQDKDFGFRLAMNADIKTVSPPIAPKPDPTLIEPAKDGVLVVPFNEAKAKEVQKSVAKSLKKEVEENADLGKGIKLEMVLIPAGKFMIGSPASEKGRSANETQHEVTLTKPFYMGKYEITQEQWEGVMGNNPSSKTKGAKLPVTDVSWNDCQEFIKKLNEKTKGGYRLPTEAEWEYACRAGTTTAYSFGGEITPKDENYGGSKLGATVVVGGYKPNAFGLYDMHGNVWEWCEDWMADYPAGAVTDPKGPATGERHVLRGGSFRGLESVARSSHRSNGSPTDRSNAGGFRLARTP
jgi:formylglycine-generating enzyme required for sulfatase activity/predicted Ser/Thr protein kinase